MPHTTSWHGFLLTEESPSSFSSILRLVVEPRLYLHYQTAEEEWVGLGTVRRWVAAWNVSSPLHQSISTVHRFAGGAASRFPSPCSSLDGRRSCTPKALNCLEVPITDNT